MAVLFLPFGRTRMLILAAPYVWRVLFNMRGLSVGVQTGPKQILISFV